MYKLYYETMGDDGMVNRHMTSENLQDLYNFIKRESIWNSHGSCRKCMFFYPFKITSFVETELPNFRDIYENLLKEQEIKIEKECEEYNKKYEEDKKEKELQMLEELKKKYEGT